MTELPESSEAVETAWRIHASLSDWTGKVDNKAVFTLSVESGMLAGTAALSNGPHSFLDATEGPAAWLLRTGVSLLVLSALLAVWVVVPRTRGAQLKQNWPENFTYFGHLRLWEPEALAQRLRTGDPLASLSRQLVVMSEVAWRKYVLVRLSLIGATAGATLTLASGVIG